MRWPRVAVGRMMTLRGVLRQPGKSAGRFAGPRIESLPPVARAHSIAVAVVPPLGSDPDRAVVRRAHPAAVDPIPAVAAPTPVTVGPYKTNAGRPADGTVIPGRGRAGPHVIAGSIPTAAAGKNSAGHNQGPAKQFL